MKHSALFQLVKLAAVAHKDYNVNTTSTIASNDIEVQVQLQTTTNSFKLQVSYGGIRAIYHSEPITDDLGCRIACHAIALQLTDDDFCSYDDIKQLLEVLFYTTAQNKSIDNEFESINELTEQLRSHFQTQQAEYTDSKFTVGFLSDNAILYNHNARMVKCDGYFLTPYQFGYLFNDADDRLTK